VVCEIEAVAIGCIPVVSASGLQLMPCEYSEAKRLLATGKAVICGREDGRLYLMLKFDPKSPIHSSPKSSSHYATPNVNRKGKFKGNMNLDNATATNEVDRQESDEKGVWSLVEPNRVSLTRLIRRVFSDRLCRKIANLTSNEKAYLNALLKAQWKRLKSWLVLKILAPIVEKMLRALGRRFEGSALHYEGSFDKEVVKGALSIMSKSTLRLISNVADRICCIAKKLGNKFADSWRKDPAFIKFLAVLVLPQNRNSYPPFSISL